MEEEEETNSEQASQPRPTNFGALLNNFYSSYLPNILSCSSVSLHNCLSQLLSVLRFRTAPYHKKKPSLPLPFPSSSSLDSSPFKTQASKVYDVLGDISSRVFFNLHIIQKNLQFWQSRAEGSNARKLYFMVLERGPRAFLNEMIELLRESVAEGGGASLGLVSQSASAYISERIVVLSALRSALASFLAKVYVEIDKCGEELAKDPVKFLPLILDTINGLFSDLEATIGHLHATRQTDSSVDGSYSFPLLFQKLPEVNQEGSQWTDCEIRDSINVVYQNIEKLDSYLALMVAKHQKPRKVTRYWIHYTCGAVGLSVCSLWILRHSSLMGSSDIDNWIHEARESTVGFFNDHVEQPKRLKGVMEVEEVQLTANSLHRLQVTSWFKHRCDSSHSSYPNLMPIARHFK